MLSLVTLDDNTGNPVTLHQDTPTGKRWLTEAHGLRGVQSLRMDKRVLSQAHGGINQTRYEDGREITLVGEIVSNVSIEDAFNEWGLITAPFIQTLDNGPALLKWQEGSGALNLIPNPNFEHDTLLGIPAGCLTSIGTTVVAGALLSVVGSGTTSPEAGAQSCAVITGSNAHQGIAEQVLASNGYAPGQTYTTTIWLKGSAGGEQVQLVLGNADFYITTVQNITLTNAWALYTVTWTAPVGSGVQPIYAAVRTQSGIPVTFYVDTWFCGTGTTYFDGDTDATYEWSGVPGNSASRHGHALQRLVKLDGDLDPPFQEGQAVLSYQTQLFAEDPRAYSQDLQTFSSVPLAVSGGGHRFNTAYPRTYGSSAGGTVSPINTGNRPTPPIFNIYGMCVNPQIVIVGGENGLTFNGTVGTGDVLQVDVSKRTVKYLPGGSILGAANRLDLYDGDNSSWFELPGISTTNPTGVTNLQLVAGSFDAGARLDVVSRSAWA